MEDGRRRFQAEVRVLAAKFYEKRKMDIGETIRKAIQDFILPELEIIKGENKEIKIALELTNKRLDDINIHLADQSRRIDDLRAELTQRIDETNERIDETNNRINRLYEVIVRREEQEKLEIRVMRLEKSVETLMRKAA
jgi:TolA-binding protein